MVGFFWICRNTDSFKSTSQQVKKLRVAEKKHLLNPIFILLTPIFKNLIIHPHTFSTCFVSLVRRWVDFAGCMGKWGALSAGDAERACDEALCAYVAVGSLFWIGFISISG